MTTGFRIAFKEFRLKNGLKQAEIAKLLHVSPAYISQVEKGESNLSADKLEILLNAAVLEEWDASALLPEYTRVSLVLDYFEARGIKNPLSEATIENMRTGEEGLSDLTVQSLCAKCLELNKEWLLTGEGEMIIQQEPVSNNDLRLMIAEQMEELNSIRSEIRELKDMLSTLLKLNK